jgi:hypothetical protein
LFNHASLSLMHGYYLKINHFGPVLLSRVRQGTVLLSAVRYCPVKLRSETMRFIIRRMVSESKFECSRVSFGKA